MPDVKQGHEMIIIGLGSNVDGPWGTPTESVDRALQALNSEVTQVVGASDSMRTKPFGNVDQPDFINAIAIIATDLPPEELMQHLHDIELAADRRRTVRWGPRTLDLDLLDYDGLVLTGTGKATGHQSPLVLPHPGIEQRAFILTQLAEIAPQWRHPVFKQTAAQLLDELPDEDAVDDA